MSTDLKFPLELVCAGQSHELKKAKTRKYLYSKEPYQGTFTKIQDFCVQAMIWIFNKMKHSLVSLGPSLIVIFCTELVP